MPRKPNKRYPQESHKAWRFILRKGEIPELPYAWQPHVRFCVWISRPNVNGTWMIRGLVQFNNDRHLGTLNTRYSKYSEWYGSYLQAHYVVNSYLTDAIPRNAIRYSYGSPAYSGIPVPRQYHLPKIGIGYKGDYPDLFEQYLLTYRLYTLPSSPPLVFDNDILKDGDEVIANSDEEDFNFSSVRPGGVIDESSINDENLLNLSFNRTAGEFI